MSETKSKYWNGRKLKSEKIITRGPNVEFGALYEANDLLIKDGYNVGMLDGDNPIAFCKGSSTPLKWHLLSKYDKAVIDGILISEDFELKDVKIIFFENDNE